MGLLMAGSFARAETREQIQRDTDQIVGQYQRGEIPEEEANRQLDRLTIRAEEFEKHEIIRKSLSAPSKHTPQDVLNESVGRRAVAGGLFSSLWDWFFVGFRFLWGLIIIGVLVFLAIITGFAQEVYAMIRTGDTRNVPPAPINVVPTPPIIAPQGATLAAAIARSRPVITPRGPVQPAPRRRRSADTAEPLHSGEVPDSLT